MEVVYQQTLIPFLKHKHLLLDTNVFLDTAFKPSIYKEFFNKLKTNDVTLVTMDLVKYELLKGASSEEKYKDKKTLIDEIVDATLPIDKHTFELAFGLIQEYGIDGTSLNTTDWLLGALLKQYGKNLCLMTRDTTDFISGIFRLPFVINVTRPKAISTYGIYYYEND